jgi:hypothetical protein
MIFIFKDKEYRGKTAAEIVRAVERDAAGYTNPGGSVRDFLVWSLARMADRIPARELDVSPYLPDETIAYNFLCLLDGCRIGTFRDEIQTPPKAQRASEPKP